MVEYTHGGDIYGKEILLDFSVNLNPLGMPQAVREAAMRGVAASEHYPDPFCRELRNDLSLRASVPAEYILCGNGAADLIFRLVQAVQPKRAMVTAPTFSEYRQALESYGCEVLSHALDESYNFDLTEYILSYICENLDMLFLCNPNNPTGRAIEPDLLIRIAERCSQHNVLLVVDECFIDLCTAPMPDLTLLLKYNSNLLLLRAFTKNYAMAGLRLGYCLCSNITLLDKMCQIAQPWSVSTPAQYAGIAAIALPEHTARARDFLRTEREWLQNELAALGLKVYPSYANYILFKAESTLIKEQLLDKNFLIRSCANYEGLSPLFYRVSIHCHEDNVRLLAALGEVLG